jgi:nitrogen PTS system EIIA component
MKLASHLRRDLFMLLDREIDTTHLYGEFCHLLKTAHVVEDAKKIKRLFVKRESLHSTAIGAHVATPHIYAPDFTSFMIGVVRNRGGIDFKGSDQKHVQLVFLIMSDDRDVGLHLKTLARISRLTTSTDLVESALKVETEEELYNLILDKDNQLG